MYHNSTTMAGTFDLFCDQSEQVIIPLQENEDQQIHNEAVAEDHNLLNFINYNDGSHLNKQSNINEELSFTQNEDIERTSVFNFQSKITHTKKEIKKKGLKFVHLQDCEVPPRAVAVLPSALYFKHGIVTPRRTLPTRVKFGPVKGVNCIISNEEANEMIFESTKSNIPIYLKRINGNLTYIDVSDKDKSNWFSLLSLGNQQSTNVWLYQDGEELYAVTVGSITPRTPLVIGYSKEYAKNYCIPEGQPIRDISEVLSEDLLAQNCERLSPKTSLQQRHNNVYHKGTKIRLRTRRGRFRCRYCTNTFSKTFSLKRHVALYCTKKPGKVLIEPESTPEVVPSTTSMSIEDNRLPSDESLQNYSNGLDISTSLFDTDRIPNLDISGSSRSETDFNLYGVQYKDDIAATVDLESHTVDGIDKKHYDNEGRIQDVPNEPDLISCSYCKQLVGREEKRQHLKLCRKIPLRCECGRVYKNREKMAQHIYTHHHNRADDKRNEDNRDYQCEKCEHSFKRRGMLVNHMWRVHGCRASLQLELRVRHYPCVACPKLYAAASKRDRHVRRHHPGVELVKGGSIECGTRVCTPAACPACPRQYVTRAKLLQHMRAAHPHLAPPKQKSSK